MTFPDYPVSGGQGVLSSPEAIRAAGHPATAWEIAGIPAELSDEAGFPGFTSHSSAVAD